MSHVDHPPQDVTATATHAALEADESAVVVDVRTRAEWAYVGLPLLPHGAEPLLLEWQVFPSMTVDPSFGDALSSALPDQDVAIYFLCRSGVRSLAAAQVMAARGYTRCFNVAGGFEGPPDGLGHRGTVSGWKAEGLPWRQS